MQKHFNLYSFSVAVLILCSLPQMVCSKDMPAGFYNNVDGLQDAQLKVALKNLIHDHVDINYGSGIGSTWEVFYYSDRDTNGYCMDMYCDDWKIINNPGDVASGCNIEHSMANSWWGGAKTPPYDDCYHLNPSNAQANSARSNYPLGVPQTNVTTAGSLKIGKIHHDSLNVDFFVFEPKDEYKGDFARAYLYTHLECDERVHEFVTAHRKHHQEHPGGELARIFEKPADEHHFPPSSRSSTGNR